MHRERAIYMAIKVGMVSLGCAKNQVDGEMLMASLKNAGFELCDDAALADVAIVNTCGFIDSAKQESIDEILELATLKKEGRIKKIVVTGCLAEPLPRGNSQRAARGGRRVRHRRERGHCGVH